MTGHATQSDAECEELLRRAAHDLRGPLNQLRAFAALLATQYRGNLPDEGQTLCAHIEQSAKQAGIVVDAIDSFGQLMRAAEPEETNLNAAMDAGLREVADLRRAGDSVARTDLGQAYGDRGMLIRLFSELLANSMKFRATIPLQVHVSAERRDGWVMVSISDNGIGIPASQAEMAFQPLRKLNGFRFEGAGMGLTLCRAIVKKHGGRIWIEPLAGEGTTVRFTLPWAAPQAAPEHP